MSKTAHKHEPTPSRGFPRDGAAREHWLARLLGSGEDPLQWSLPLFRIAGVQLRLHLVLVAWAAAELLISARPDVQGPLHRFSLVVALVCVVVVREALRVFLLWGRGWLPDRMVIWQGGALSSPLGLAPRMRAPVTGLILSFLLVAVAGVALLSARVPTELLWFNPLDPTAAASSLRSVGQIALFWTYYSTLVVCGLNLLPMLPMDLGRLLQCAVSRQLGQRAALRAAARVGLAVAVTVFMFGVVSEQMRLTGIAAIGAAVSWIELRRLAFIESAEVNPSLDLVEWIAGEPEVDFVQPPVVEIAAGASDLGLPSLDDVLAKVGRTGLESLTKIERTILSQETDRLRGRKGG